MENVKGNLVRMLQVHITWMMKVGIVNQAAQQIVMNAQIKHVLNQLLSHFRMLMEFLLCRLQKMPENQILKLYVKTNQPSIIHQQMGLLLIIIQNFHGCIILVKIYLIYLGIIQFLIQYVNKQCQIVQAAVMDVQTDRVIVHFSKEIREDMSNVQYIYNSNNNTQQSAFCQVIKLNTSVGTESLQSN
ncbi:unnamed protein product [Paramecium primaurelia]|uniref:Transmembrane protein n=1 Tax=Paramecium primaurelia TaxID=5886 RepID=A0A8S1PKF0_PARPR|nr:unnamed protein product [Paramecium primaurelia]